MSQFLKARTAAVAVGTAALMAAGASAASATTLSNGGGPLAAGSTISGPLVGTASLQTALGPSSCSAGTLGGTVGTNPAPTVAITSPVFTLNTCTGPTPPGGALKINSANLASVTTAGITYGSAAASTLGITGANITLNVTASGLTQNCNMTANSATGIARNADNSITFTNVPVTGATGVCARALPAQFSAKFGPMTSGGSAVTVNP
ncbi:hypothetical protein [Patulibacter americanus]|uniref:hypothetical protein n=1 Tax=Patulibacter americanus TaxID=588672 RepID=UPI0003B43180|nr:hypothetical protein [Patulibacter americanus]